MDSTPAAGKQAPYTVSPEYLKLVYDATAGMDWPDVPGIKAPTWWKSLLEIVYNTALRRRTLFELRMDEIDWPNNCLRLKGERFNNGRPMIVHLNPAAMEALRRIRTARPELIFPTNATVKTFTIICTAWSIRPAFREINISACTSFARRRRRS